MTAPQRCTANGLHLGIGAPCPECGHTSALHPGVNPALTVCAVCDMEAGASELRAELRAELSRPGRDVPPYGYGTIP